MICARRAQIRPPVGRDRFRCDRSQRGITADNAHRGARAANTNNQQTGMKATGETRNGCTASPLQSDAAAAVPWLPRSGGCNAPRERWRVRNGRESRRDRERKRCVALEALRPTLA
ncbi:hypothetical protein EMIT0111MI5_20605 [Burkholderia sp. IT-111MI5]